MRKRLKFVSRPFQLQKFFFWFCAPRWLYRSFIWVRVQGQNRQRPGGVMLAAAQPVTSLFQPHLWVLRVRVQISLGEKIPPEETSLFRWRGYKLEPRRNPKLLRTVREILLCVMIRLCPSGLITALYRHRIGKEWKQRELSFLGLQNHWR